LRLAFSGMERIDADKATVRAFLTDSSQVSACLPDLQEVTLVEDRHFVAIVKVGVGPVRGRFKMDVRLDPEVGPDELALELRGSGMGSGMELRSSLRLEEQAPRTTHLHWAAEATVSGPLASVGGRLLEGQARKTTEQLFTAIRTALEAAGEVAVGRGDDP
jgi:carbon monoxide dehydrogenase subunit G